MRSFTCYVHSISHRFAFTILILLSASATMLHAQNVGVGTTAPLSKLSVSGNLAIGAGYTDTIGPTDGAIIKGRTGLGTRRANTQLDINGGVSTRPTGAVVAMTAATTSASPLTLTVGDLSYIQLSSTGTDPSQHIFTLSAGLQAGQHLFVENTTPAFVARVLTAGNVSLTYDTLTLGKAYGIVAAHFLWTGSKWIDIGNNVNKVVALTLACVEPTTKVSFAYTGSAQTWTVPSGVTTIRVRLWGGGGAGGNYGGGGAGYVTGYMTVTPGTAITVMVGQGGSKTGVVVYGGGGKSNSTTGTGGGGGGRSALLISGADVVTAGGGGGGGTFSFGGGGGGLTGMDGSVPSGCTGEQGRGGTQAAGGAAGVSCGSTAYTGTAGTQYTGGNASATFAAGSKGAGGGGGYYGGGSGGSNYGSGGGGGSSYVGMLLDNSCYTFKNLQGTIGASSSSAAPGGATETDYVSGIGVGWGGGVTGANGLVVIYY